MESEGAVPSTAGVPVLPSGRGSQKRASDSAAEEQTAKRAKSDIVSSEPPLPPPDALEEKPYLQPDVQCAFYGIELLRATWDKTHSIVTLLSGMPCLHPSEVQFTDHLIQTTISGSIGTTPKGRSKPILSTSSNSSLY